MFLSLAVHKFVEPKRRFTIDPYVRDFDVCGGFVCPNPSYTSILLQYMTF